MGAPEQPFVIFTKDTFVIVTEDATAIPRPRSTERRPVVKRLYSGLYHTALSLTTATAFRRRAAAIPAQTVNRLRRLMAHGGSDTIKRASKRRSYHRR